MLRKVALVVRVASLMFAGTVNMDLNAKYGATNFHTKGAVKYATLVKKYTNGSVNIKVYAGSSPY